jgi:CheY-like chemotaxis protein
MEEIGNLLDGLAALAWPTLVFFILWRFADPIRSVIESAKKRKFTIKVGDNELTMEEITEQQRRIINDLQKQIALLPTEKGPPAESVDVELGPQEISEAPSILWVDDNPRNNAYEISQLQDMGVTVTTALTTVEALELFGEKKFDRVISDMARKEDGSTRGKAGIELARKIREVDSKVPIIIYCGAQGARALRQETLNAGANEITSSPTTLLRSLNVASKTDVR